MQQSPGNRTAVANLMVNENILDVLRYFFFFNKEKTLKNLFISVLSWKPDVISQSGVCSTLSLK